MLEHVRMKNRIPIQKLIWVATARNQKVSVETYFVPATKLANSNETNRVPFIRGGQFGDTNTCAIASTIDV